MGKRGTSEMLWIVVVVVLLLVAMVVIGFIFGSGVGDFLKGYKDCASKEGSCQTKGSCPGKVIYIADCNDPNKECCLKEK